MIACRPLETTCQTVIDINLPLIIANSISIIIAICNMKGDTLLRRETMMGKSRPILKIRRHLRQLPLIM